MTARNAKICEWTIASGIVLFGLLLVVSFRAVVPLALILALLLVVFGPRDGLLDALRRSRLGYALGALWLVGAASVLWTINPDQTQPKVFQLAAIFSVGLLFVLQCWRVAPFLRLSRIRNAAFISVMTCVLGILAVINFGEFFISLGVPDRFFWGTAYLANRPIITLCVLLWLIFLFDGGVVLKSIIFLICACLFVWIARKHDIGIAAPLFALALAAVGGAAAMAIGARAMRAVLPIGVAVACLAAPALTAYVGGPLLDALRDAGPDGLGRLAHFTSGEHRLEIWLATVERIAERPILGWGLDAARNVPATAEAIGGRVRSTISLHTHNGALQIWLELGALGAFASAAAAYYAIRGVFAAAPRRGTAAVAAAAVFSAIAIWSVSFGVFQSWWLVSLILIAGFGAIALRGREADAAD